MKGKIASRLCFLCLFLAASSAGMLRAAKYPPGSHWREIGRGPFTVIFPADNWQQAEAALASAERAYQKLAAFWRDPPAGRIRVVLDDSTDQANGFATFYPFNLVGVNLAEPPPDSELAASRSWLDLVLTHELTHIFTLNAVAEPFLKLRRVFGSQPILYPAVQLPPWVIEGLGVYGESEFTGDGRLNHPPFGLMLAAARRDGMFPGWSRIAGMPAAWPGPAGKYLFGAGFMEFLAETYGADSLRRYLDLVSSRLLLISSSRDFKKTFGAPLGKLWAAYRDDKPSAGGPAPEPLTNDGFLQQYPCLLGEDRLLYYRRDYQSRGEVAVLDLNTGQDKALFKMDAVNGLSVAEDGKRILLSAVENFHAFSEFSDLYEYDLDKGKLKRLSRGQRLSQPAASSDPLVRPMGGRQAMNDMLEKNDMPIVEKEFANIYCVQRRDGSYCLSSFDAQTGRSAVLSRPFAGMAQPAVNPNGQMIAAAVKPEGGPWGIAFFWKDGELGRFISVPGSNLSQPRWLSAENLLFISSGKERSCLASYNLAENPSAPCPGGPSYSCDDPRLAGLQQFAVADNDWDIFFTYYSGRGQEIGRLNYKDSGWSPLEITVTEGIPETTTASPVTTPLPLRPYRFWRDLLPRWWSPALRAGGDEVQAGIMTGGQDALGIHSYDMEGYFGFSSHRPSLRLRYVYDGLFPTLSLTYAYRSDYFRDAYFSERTQELTLASHWPLRLRKRSRLYAYADLHLEKHSLIHEDESHEFASHFNGLRLGLDFHSARDYYDSISAADGIQLTIQGTWQPSGVGNERPGRSAQADLRFYLPVARPGVLAGRLALAKSWEAGSSYYDLGGREQGGGLGSDRPFRLLRGFPAGYQWGDRGYLLNLEYRLPLFRIEKAVLPSVGLNRTYFNAFLDLGRVWSAGMSADPALALGAEVALRLAVGGAAFADLALGAAHGFGPEKQTWIYLRTGKSF